MKFLRFFAAVAIFAAVACEGVTPDDNNSEKPGDEVIDPDNNPDESGTVINASAFLKNNDSEGFTISVSNNIFQIGVDTAYFVIRYNGAIVNEGYKLYESGQSVEAELPTTKARGADGKIYTIPYWSPESTDTKSFWGTYKTSNTKKTPVTVTATALPIPERIADPNPDNTSFKRRSMVMDFTGSSCGWCPFIIAAIDEVVDLEGAVHADDAVVAEIHSYNTSSMNPLEGLGITSYCGVNGYPTVMFDYKTTVGANQSHSVNVNAVNKAIEKTLAVPATAGLSANYLVDKNVVQARVTVKAGTTGNFRVGMIVLEDGIYEKQSNNGAVEAFADQFNIHNDVSRYIDALYMTNNYSGHDLGTLNKGDYADYVFTKVLDESKVNVANCHLAFFVVDATSGVSITNAIKTKNLNGSVAFEYE